MSEHGWKDFNAADGLDDWAVLHGGPTAVFRTGSLVDAAQLAEAMAAVPGLAGTRVALSITDGRLAVRLTREMWERRIAPCRACQGGVGGRSRARRDRRSLRGPGGAGRDRGQAGRDRPWVLARDPRLRRDGRRQRHRPARPRLDRVDAGSRREQDTAPRDAHRRVGPRKTRRRARLAAALAAGGRIVDESDAPGSWILADRAGNKVCIAAWPDGAVARPGAPDAEGGVDEA